MGLPPEGPNASSVCCHPAICESGPTWGRENVNLKRPRFVIMLQVHVNTQHVFTHIIRVQVEVHGTNFQDGRVGCMHFSPQT
jgi:hypothetical protein